MTRTPLSTSLFVSVPDHLKKNPAICWCHLSLWRTSVYWVWTMYTMHPKQQIHNGNQLSYRFCEVGIPDLIKRQSNSQEKVNKAPTTVSNSLWMEGLIWTPYLLGPFLCPLFFTSPILPEVLAFLISYVLYCACVFQVTVSETVMSNAEI